MVTPITVKPDITRVSSQFTAHYSVLHSLQVLNECPRWLPLEDEVTIKTQYQGRLENIDRAGLME